MSRAEIEALVRDGEVIGRERSCAGVNLAGACLAQASFNECAMTRANLSGAEALLWNAVKCGLRGAEFGRANLTNANLVECRLKRASFAGATMARLNIIKCRTDEIDISGTVCEDVIFIEGDFTRAGSPAAPRRAIPRANAPARRIRRHPP